MTQPQRPTRRQWLASSTALALAMGLATSAVAQGNNQPVRILVGFPAGGGVDAVARHVADALGQQMGQSFVVDNRTGAGGQIAAVALKQAAPNGQTLFMSNDHTVVIVPQTMKAPGFNPATDFTPVARITQVAFGLAVHPSTQAQRLADYGCANKTIAQPLACRPRPACPSSPRPSWASTSAPTPRRCLTAVARPWWPT